MADIHSQNSRYINTPEVDFYLDLWQDISIPKSSNDLEITIEPKYHQRPDLLSFELYGTPKLWWVFMQRNVDVLFDPIYDFNAGTKIFAPTRDQIETYI